MVLPQGTRFIQYFFLTNSFEMNMIQVRCDVAIIVGFAILSAELSLVDVLSRGEQAHHDHAVRRYALVA